MATEAQIEANRQNAQLSSGPVTAEGKNRSSHNAIKTGLTGQTVLLPSDNVEAYQTHVVRLNEQFKPATDEERTLVQAIADTEWRLLRIPSLEAGVLAVGRSKMADLYPNESDPATRAAFIEAEVQIAFRKDLSNLALQETRLRRHRQLDTEKLESIQSARKQAAKPRQNMSLAVRMYESAIKSGRTFVPEVFGFEFSLADIEHHIALEDFKGNMCGQYNNMSRKEYEEAFARFVPAKTKAGAPQTNAPKTNAA